MIKTICHISDTHQSHEQLTIPECDLLIHSGDFTYAGEIKAVNNFLQWFQKQPAKYKIFIAGNHELTFEKSPGLIKALMEPYLNDKFIYLENNWVVIEGLVIYGSPITPEFCNWAFNKMRGEEINKYWEMIPENVDILVTHGPAHGILDKVHNQSVGCEDLARKILHIAPQWHLFGHIHSGYGLHTSNGTTYSNASINDNSYYPINKPQFFVLD